MAIMKAVAAQILRWLLSNISRIILDATAIIVGTLALTWCSPSVTNNIDFLPASPANVAAPQATPIPTATSTPIPELVRDLNAAKAIPNSTEKNYGLRSVAQIAVRAGNYAIAIEAGASSPSSIEKARTLSFVALCAVEDERIDMAYKAADEISISAEKSRVIREILSAVNRRPSVPDSFYDQNSRECFGALLE